MASTLARSGREHIGHDALFLAEGGLRRRWCARRRRGTITACHRHATRLAASSAAPPSWNAWRPLAHGYTNRQIATQLTISVKTASVHVSHILGKLGVSHRVEAAAIAQKLHPPTRARRRVLSR